MYRIRNCICLLSALIFISGTLAAQPANSAIWNGKKSTSWADAENWDNGIPSTGNVTIRGYQKNNPALGGKDGIVGKNLILESGAKLVVDAELIVNGNITVMQGAEIQVSEDCILKSIGESNWIIDGTLTLLPGSSAWSEGKKGAKNSIVINGSLIAKGTEEKWIAIKGSPYPKGLMKLQIGGANVFMDYVTMPDVGSPIVCSNTPRAYELSHLKTAGRCSTDLYSSATLLITESNLLSPVNLYYNATLELVRCDLNNASPVNFFQKLDKGWVISREDVDNKGAYIYWPGLKGMDWHAGRVPPGNKDNVMIKANKWNKDSSIVTISYDATCNDLHLEKGTKLVIKENAKLTINGKFVNDGIVDAKDKSIIPQAKQ